MKNYLLGFLLLGTQIAYASNGLIQNEDVKSVTDITAASLTTTGNIATGTHCITSPGTTQNLSIGLYVYDVTHPTYIPSGTTIVSLPGTCSTGQIQISANATSSSSGDTLTFGGRASQLINDSKIYVTGSGMNDQLSTLLTNNSILNNGSTAPAILSKLLLNKSSSTPGFGGPLEIQNNSNTYSGVLTDSVGRGFRIGTPDFNDSTTGSLLGLSLGAGTGSTYGRIQVYNAGGSTLGPLALNADGGNVGIGTTNPTALLEVNGSTKINSLAGVGNRFVTTDATGLLGSGVFIYPAVTGPKTADYTLTNLDSTVTFDTTSGSLTATLPTAVGISGQSFTIFYAAGPNNQSQVIVNTTAGQTISGRDSGRIILGTLNDFVTVQSNGSNWIILAKKETPLYTNTSYISNAGSANYSSFAVGTNFPLLSNNSMSLSVGTWRLRARFVLLTTGDGRFTINMGGSVNKVWFASNGANVSTSPTALPNYIPYEVATFNYTADGGNTPGSGAYYFQVPEYGGIITITSGSQTVFAVPNILLGNPDVGQIQWLLSAERIW